MGRYLHERLSIIGTEFGFSVAKTLLKGLHGFRKTSCKPKGIPEICQRKRNLIWLVIFETLHNFDRFDEALLTFLPFVLDHPSDTELIPRDGQAHVITARRSTQLFLHCIVELSQILESRIGLIHLGCGNAFGVVDVGENAIEFGLSWTFQSL